MPLSHVHRATNDRVAVVGFVACGRLLVVMLRVPGQNPPEVPFAVDQEVVEALAPQRSHIPLGKRIRLG